MKVVIQNGCVHALTRKEVESMVSLFPARWSKGVETIAFYQGKEPKITTEYYAKEKILGLFFPKEPRIDPIKIEAVEEMLIGLECVAENEDLPRKMPKSTRNYFLEKTTAIRKQCLGLVKEIAT